jgi:hypothetical protein
MSQLPRHPRAIVATVAVAAGALAVVWGPSALAAAPEFGRCLKEPGGKYENGGCTKEKVGATKFEWYPAAGKAANGREKPLVKRGFSIAKEVGSEEASFETVGRGLMKCTEEIGTGGEYVGSGASTKELRKLVVRWVGCKEETFKTKCQNTATEGEIVTNPLEGELGVVKAGAVAVNDRVGVDLKPEAPATTDAVFKCAGGAITHELRGSLIDEVKTNAMLLTRREVWKCTLPGKQVPEEFEVLPKDVLEINVNGGGFEQACWRAKAITTNEEKIEALG